MEIEKKFADDNIAPLLLDSYVMIKNEDTEIKYIYRMIFITFTYSHV